MIYYHNLIVVEQGHGARLIKAYEVFLSECYEEMDLDDSGGNNGS